MQPDWQGIITREQSIPELEQALTLADLQRFTTESIAAQRDLLADLVDDDVVFLPDDPEAAEGEDAWTIGHVIVHATASSEEGAALGLTLARGAEVTGRSRYETPWETVTTADQVRQRLEESGRMREAMLAAWPEAPHLDNIDQSLEYFGPMNAIGRVLVGLAHEHGHFEQISRTIQQSQAARGGG